MEDIRMELPPGFRFHPTDEELITYYLSKKILDNNFSTKVMGQVDLNMVEPWDLPSKTKTGETEWYFFCVKDKKYPTGLRTNRATVAGYWKATGKDKEIFQAKTLIGMKKTLVFYKGRAPRGEKTNWIMHEYRLEGKIPLLNHPSAAKSDWVICRVFEKDATGKKIHYSGLASLNSIGNGSSSVLPPLTDCSPSSVSETVHGSHFSDPIEAQKNHQGVAGYVNNSLFGFSSNPMGISLPSTCNSNQVTLQFPSSVPIQDRAFLKGLMENNKPNFRQIPKTEDGVISISQETGLSNDRSTGISSVVSNVDFGRSEFEDYEVPSALVTASEFDYVWNY